MDIPAHDGVSGNDGCTMVQLFTEITFEHMVIYPIGTKADFPHAFEDFIHDHGTMHSHHSDNVHKELSALTNELFKMYVET